MIPLKLTVRNFMCYRDNLSPLDLESLHVVCLCGDNGHGKTALLDAITWALWGKARAQTQEELIHQGQHEMAVELEFLARDQRHRVSRRYSRSVRSRQGNTLLEFQVASENGYRSISGNTVRETEARIREILHLDYDTFVNTAFLLQGQADRFTRSTPAERKATLAEVLGLSYYQVLEERAKKQSKLVLEKMRHTESEIAIRQREVGRKSEYLDQLTSVRSTIDKVGPEVEAKRLRVEELRATVESLKGRQDDRQALDLRLADGRREVEDLERQVRVHQEKVKGYEAALERDAEIRERFSELVQSRADLERLNQALARKSTLDQERARTETEVAVQRARLSSQVDHLLKRITEELRPKVDRIPQVEQSSRDAASEQTELSTLEESITQQRDEAQEAAARISYLEQADADLRSEMEQTRKKFDMLGQGEAMCPLCKTPLGPDGREHLRLEYESVGQKAKQQYQAQEAERDALSLRHWELRVQLDERDGEHSRRREQLQAKIASNERDLLECRKARDELGPATAELEEAQAQLREERFAVEERRRLAQLDSEISALGYEGERHRGAQEQVKALEPFAEFHRRLLAALEALPHEREALETGAGMLARRRREVEQDERRRAELEQELSSLPRLETELEVGQRSLQGLGEQLQAELVTKGVLEQHIARCSTLETEVRRLEKERGELVDEKGVYDELAVAFGKNGIQALIIETAIPQLQDDSSELLGRLTDQRMSLKLQLQEGRRERRMGLPSEELEIKISDDLGTRSYEMFSGGEAFRISFALRIALSKLLARRSGAPLPILFIDEGFGSQDADGQERLKEAIQSIQSDFQKIIVITHLEQVKESFPTRIEVTKTPSGSTFVVV